MTFLDEVAAQLIENHGKEFQNVAVVLPSKRASLFLKKAIAARLKETFWAPTTLTFSDLVNQFHDQTILDRTSLAFELFEVYQATEKNPETFDQFYKWGEVLLADYNEIDLYLLEAEDVFRDLRNIHQLESWNMDAFTEMQEKYLGFWQKLGPLYKAFKDHLKAKKLNYSGGIYKQVSQQLKMGSLENSPYNAIYFVGFNAISPSEIDIIQTLKRQVKTEVIWDADKYYVENPHHEAGHFLRTIGAKYPELTRQQTPEILDTPDKKITVYASNTYVGQARIAAQIVSEIAPIVAYEKCALVLPEPSMLIPVLNELPNNLETANVTMGYPLHNTEIVSLVQYILLLQDNIRKQNETGIYLHFKPFLRLIKHPVLRGAYSDLEELEHKIRFQNKVFIQQEDLSQLGLFNDCPGIFKKWDDLNYMPIVALRQLLESLKLILAKDQQSNRINLEAIDIFGEVLSKLEQLLTDYPHITQLSTLRKVINGMVRNHEMSFFGEPLSGLQVMGLLETRCLDFENLILLSVNEGVLPKGKYDSSILPYDLKKYHNLPGTKEHDSVLAYYFFRLIQRARNVHLVYAPVSDGFGPGEKSRFILQLEQELKQAQLKEKTYSVQIGEKLPAKSVVKDLLFYNQLRDYLENEDKGLSVSAINRFIRCPLDFYYTYICGLREENKVEEQIEDSSMGSIVHSVLEDIYRPFLGSPLEITQLLEAKKNVHSKVESKFLAHLNQRKLQGNNYISKEIAITMVERVLDMDIEHLTQGNKITLLGVEESIHTHLEHTAADKQFNVRLIGTVDRIDQFNEEVRVIDYKTGSVNKDSVKPLNLDAEFQSKDEKAVQLAYYSYIYSQIHPETNVSGWIFAIRNSQQVEFKGKVKEFDTHSEEFRDKFKASLLSLLTDMTNSQSPIVHNQASDYCRVCE